MMIVVKVWNPAGMKPAGFFNGEEHRRMEISGHPTRMDIWYANLPLHPGSSVQGGRRPVVVISNNICNTVSTVITVAPLTRQMKRLKLPTHVVINAPDGKQSVVLAEQIMTIDRDLLDSKIGRIPKRDEKKIEAAIKEQLGMRGETK